MHLTLELKSNRSNFALNSAIYFNKLRVNKMLLNTNGLNNTNSILLFKINSLCNSKMYDSENDNRRHNEYTFMSICPPDVISSYDRSMNNYDWESPNTQSLNNLSIEVYNNNTELVFGPDTRITIELEFI